MVRLRAPARTSVYGFADGTSVTWTLSGTDRAERQVVEVTHTVTAPVVDGAWKVTLDPQKKGGVPQGWPLGPGVLPVLDSKLQEVKKHSEVSMHAVPTLLRINCQRSKTSAIAVCRPV